MENNIATIRLKQGISQQNLAKMVGTSPNWMNKVERGKKRASMKMYEKIAKELKVSIKDIFLD